MEFVEREQEEQLDKLQEEHRMRLLLQRLKIQKEHERIFGRHFKNVFMKYINECHLNTDCEIERVYEIYTTRFTSDTYYQNMRHKQNIGWDGALYSTMLTFPANVPDKLLFILDMNNTTNKIMGIGLVRNVLAQDQSPDLYLNPAFNNYIYKSAYYIPLAEIYGHGDDVQYDSEWRKYIEDEFEKKLFYGKSHSKRGGSFMKFPHKFKQRKHLFFLVSLFVSMNTNNFVENVMNKVKF
jgi:hypothetical protein